MPSDPRGRNEVLEWVFAALNSVEMASLPWSIFKFTGDTAETPGRKHLDEFLKARLQHMEAVLAKREWLAGTFSVADILMADVLPHGECAAPCRSVGRASKIFRLSRLRRARHGPPILCEGIRRPDGPLCCGRCSLINVRHHERPLPPDPEADVPRVGQGLRPAFAFLRAADEQARPQLRGDLQSVVVALASLGRSRRHSRPEGWNIIALQRRRSYHFHLRWGATSQICVTLSPACAQAPRLGASNPTDRPTPEPLPDRIAGQRSACERGSRINTKPAEIGPYQQLIRGSLTHVSLNDTFGL